MICVLVGSQAMCRPVHFVFLVLVVCLEASVGQGVGLVFEILSNGRIGGKYLVLVVVYSLFLLV